MWTTYKLCTEPFSIRAKGCKWEIRTEMELLLRTPLLSWKTEKLRGLSLKATAWQGARSLLDSLAHVCHSSCWNRGWGRKMNGVKECKNYQKNIVRLSAQIQRQRKRWRPSSIAWRKVGGEPRKERKTGGRKVLAGRQNSRSQHRGIASFQFK